MNENEFRHKGLAAGLTPEHAQQLADIFRRAGAAFEEATQAFQILSYKAGQLIELCPNKRLVYLALHHPKERVRKKNINRIFKKEL